MPNPSELVFRLLVVLQKFFFIGHQITDLGLVVDPCLFDRLSNRMVVIIFAKLSE